MIFMKKKAALFLLLSLLIILTGCSQKVATEKPTRSSAELVKTTDYSDYNTQEKNLEHFIKQKLVTKKGIYTNYSKQKYIESEARGHEMLSESSGLWLEHLAYTHQYKAFRNFYKQTKATFDQGNQFSYRYVPAKNKKFSVNATLDDLRIIKALQMYSQLTKDKSYHQEAVTRFAKLQKHTMQRGKIASFYDTSAHKASTDSALPYYDLLTLRYFESGTKASKKMYRQQLTVVQDGFLGDAFPLYATTYNWQSKSYSKDNLNTSEALETLLHLSEVGKVKKVSLNWLTRQVKNNTLYNAYTNTGGIVDSGHSAGSYALAAEIFATNGNQKMYHQAMNLVWKYQISDKSSPMYGAIGLEQKKEAYSYNNLNALIASQY